MSEIELQQLRNAPDIAAWRLRLATWVESRTIQFIIIALIIVNAVVLGAETSPELMSQYGGLLKFIDKACLTVFIIELLIKFVAYRFFFWKSGWNVFDFIVIGFALAPAAGPWSILRSLRVLRVLRMLTVVPQLRKVVAAFLHAIPGLLGIVALAGIFFYTAGVLSTNLFGQSHPEWFGTLGSSLFSLFQIMTLESWSMGIVRPLMETHPWAWVFFVPFIVIATFTILNLFIGIIVSTMQELSTLPDPNKAQAETHELLQRVEESVRQLRAKLDANDQN